MRKVLHYCPECEVSQDKALFRHKSEVIAEWNSTKQEWEEECVQGHDEEPRCVGCDSYLVTKGLIEVSEQIMNELSQLVSEMLNDVNEMGLDGIDDTGRTYQERWDSLKHEMEEGGLD